MRLRNALATCTALVALGAACSSERIDLDLAVAAAPNPVVGAADAGERRWSYAIGITNTTGVGVFLESFHKEIKETDTGYEQPLVPVTESDFAGRYVRPGETFVFPVSERTVGASFTRGVERRVYHTRGDDGRFYSGEVTIVLQ